MKNLTTTQRIILSLTLSLLLSVGVFLLVLLPKGEYTLASFTDASFLSGVITLLIGALIYVGYLGAFNIFTYGFKSIFKHMKVGENQSIDEMTYTNYVKSKRLEREYHHPILWPTWALGGGFLLASFILRLILG